MNPADTPSASPPSPREPDLEMQKFEFEKYKARLEYRKFVLGSVFVAIAIALIPPSFQLATAFLEYVKSQAKLQADAQATQADRETKQEEFRQTYIKDFLANALNQDIELRIRFAEYFSFVSAGTIRQGWIDYRTDLVSHRDKIRTRIDGLESDWQQLAASRPRGDAEMDRIERNLAWSYKEVGYVEKNRSVAANPRVPDAVRGEAPTESSGKSWVFRFENDSRLLESLDPDFSANLKAFLTALGNANAKVEVRATRRRPERAYLMHFAWAVAKNQVAPEAVPPFPGVNIVWAHLDANGAPDQAKSRAAAVEMVNGFGIVAAPQLVTRHTQGLAADMEISWDGTLSIARKDGQVVPIDSAPRNGTNRDLATIGATYGVVKGEFDPPHWSNDGK